MVQSHAYACTFTSIAFFNGRHVPPTPIRHRRSYRDRASGSSASSSRDGEQGERMIVVVDFGLNTIPRLNLFCLYRRRVGLETYFAPLLVFHKIVLAFHS